MKQHTIIGGYFLRLIKLAGGTLRITATQITGRQYRLHAYLIQHGLGGQTDLRKQAFRAATRKIKHRFGIGSGFISITNDGYNLITLNTQQRSCRFGRHVIRHFPVGEMKDKFTHRRLAS